MTTTKVILCLSVFVAFLVLTTVLHRARMERHQHSVVDDSVVAYDDVVVVVVAVKVHHRWLIVGGDDPVSSGRNTSLPTTRASSCSSD